VEIATGATFALLFWHFSLGAELAVAAFYFCLFLVILVIDLEKLVVMPMIIILGIIVAIVFSIFFSESSMVPGLADSAIGGAIGLGIFLAIFLVAFAIYRGKGFGLGDVYIGVLMGFVLGFPNIFVGILLSFWIGGIAAILLVLLKLRGLKQLVPLGVFLSVGTVITLFWGTPILDWYTGFF
jgi:leader peptidase (prepilin peptidase)/N-methyltransferase